MLEPHPALTTPLKMPEPVSIGDLFNKGRVKQRRWRPRRIARVGRLTTASGSPPKPALQLSRLCTSASPRLRAVGRTTPMEIHVWTLDDLGARDFNCGPAAAELANRNESAALGKIGA